MTPGRKLGKGCWTCRLRRKRCDTVQPICGSCQNLEITCYSGETKPPWMDGGARQKHMSEKIKQAIKQNAHLRRGKRSLDYGYGGGIITPDSDSASYTDPVPTLTSPPTSRVSDVTAEYASLADAPTSTSLTTPDIPPVLQRSLDRSEQYQPSFTTPSSVKPIHVELGSVMIYLDYVFPFLFPFYQPSLIETGRQWLLGLLCQNEASFHISASLSAYFFSLVPQSDEQDLHDDCKALVLDRLVEQMDLAIASIQNTVSAISRHGTQSPLLDRVRVMEEITQLLMVEVTVRRNTDWAIHLTPALALFDEIFKTYGFNDLGPSLAVLANALPSSLPMTAPHNKPLPNTADQSALVFFVSLLLFVDVISSTSICEPPTLQSYHQSLLSPSNESFCVRLEAVVGCQNWAVVAIGNISALCAWKHKAKQSGNFSVINLINLADPISKSLEAGLKSLDVSANYTQPKNTIANRLEAYYSRHDRLVDDLSIANITRIWAYTAKIYLSVCLSGWQPKSTDIQANVLKVLSLLKTIESPAQLRSLSWPIAVGGCLALPNQEHDFRDIVEKMGHLGEFGTVLNALHIMEAVWRSRDTINGDVWDIASSLSILGPPALLL